MPEEYTRFTSAQNGYREFREFVHRNRSREIDSNQFVVKIEKEFRNTKEKKIKTYGRSELAVNTERLRRVHVVCLFVLMPSR